MSKHIFKVFFVALLALILLIPSSMTLAATTSLPLTSQLSRYEPCDDSKQNHHKKYILSTCDSTLLAGDSFQLSLYGVESGDEVTFRSDNDSVLSLDQINISTYRCTGKSVGKTKIIVKIRENNGFLFMHDTTILKCKVNVNPKALSVKFKKSKYTLYEGASKKTSITLRPSITTEKPIYSCLNTQVATVSENGKIYGKSKGATTLTASLQNGKIARCKIIVKTSNNYDYD